MICMTRKKAGGGDKQALLHSESKILTVLPIQNPCTFSHLFISLPSGAHDSGGRTTTKLWTEDHFWSKSHLWLALVLNTICKAPSSIGLMAHGWQRTQHRRLDSEIQSQQGRTEKIYTEDVSAVMVNTDSSLLVPHSQNNETQRKEISIVTLTC